MRSVIVAILGVSLSTVARAQAPTVKAHLERTLSGHTAEAREVTFSPDGHLLATSSVDGTVKLWRVPEGTLVRTLTHPVGITSVAFSPDGQWIVSGSYDHVVRIWRLSDGTLAQTLTGHTGAVWSVAFSPDGQLIASCGEDKTIRLWNAIDGALSKTLTGHTLNVWHLSFSPDGQWLVSGSFDKTVKVWRVESGSLARTLTAHIQAVVAVDWSTDGAIASGGDDSSIRLWSAKDGRLRTTLSAGNHVYSVAFSPDGQWLASAGRGRSALGTFWHQIAGERFSIGKGETVRLWRVSDGVLQQILTSHTDDAWSVTFSPDGKWLATGSEDKTVKLWRLILDGRP